MIERKCFALALVTLLLPVAVAVSAAAAQDKPATAPQATESKVRPAPVGHRQPTAADIAKAQQDSAAGPDRYKSDRELDKRLQICRGC